MEAAQSALLQSTAGQPLWRSTPPPLRAPTPPLAHVTSSPLKVSAPADRMVVVGRTSGSTESTEFTEQHGGGHKRPLHPTYSHATCRGCAQQPIQQANDLDDECESVFVSAAGAVAVEDCTFDEAPDFYPLEACAGSSFYSCLLYTSPSPRDRQKSRMPSSA